MPLPKIDLPTYEIVLPTSKKTVTFRPFVTREEKILLMASEGGDEKEMIHAMKQVVNNCCLTKLDVDKLSLIDLEYFFLKLRAKSVGEVVEVKYLCQNEIDGKKCHNVVAININIDKLQVEFPEKDLSVIEIGNQMYLKLRYPTFEILEEVADKDLDNIDNVFELIAQCVESVVKEDEVFDTFTLGEAVDFLQDLPKEKFEQVKDFFENQPEIRVKFPFRCICGFQEEMEIVGTEELSAFFD